MLKIKRRNKFAVIATLIFCLLAMHGNILFANAASMYNVSDTLSDSDPQQSANHTIAFTTGIDLEAGDYIDVVLAADFGDVTTGTCPAGFNAFSAPNTETGQCVSTAGSASNTPYTITLIGITNPTNEGSYTVSISSKENGSGTVIETASIKVYIIQDVTLSATVDPRLTFTIDGVDQGTTINTVTTTATSTATTTPFGTLVVDQDAIVAQKLSVSTNATDGYVITVFQDGELENSAGAVINSFDNAPVGAASTTPKAWVNPSALIDQPDTYGHMGLTSNDTTGAGGDMAIDYSGGKFAGLAGSNPLEVAVNNGPANSLGEGVNFVAYRVRISALQEAGDYTSTLTYVCTARY